MPYAPFRARDIGGAVSLGEQGNGYTNLKKNPKAHQVRKQAEKSEAFSPPFSGFTPPFPPCFGAISGGKPDIGSKTKSGWGECS